MIRINKTKEEFIKDIKKVMGISQGNKDRLNGKLDLQLRDVKMEEDKITFEFKSKEWCKNPFGTIHGGIICSIFDTAMGTGAVAICNGQITTTDLNVNFLRPMVGEDYVIEAEYVFSGKTLIRSEGRIYDAESGKLCATALAGFMILPYEGEGLRD